MTARQFRAELDRLDLSQAGAARFLRVDPRTVRRWALGEIPVPHMLALLLARMTTDDAIQ